MRKENEILEKGLFCWIFKCVIVGVFLGYKDGINIKMFTLGKPEKMKKGGRIAQDVYWKYCLNYITGLCTYICGFICIV